MKEQFEKFVRHVEAVVVACQREHFPKLKPPTVGYDEGPKYWRVWINDGRSKTAAGFVGRDGCIYRPDGWKKPGVLVATLDDYADTILCGNGVAALRGMVLRPSVYPPRPE